MKAGWGGARRQAVLLAAPSGLCLSHHSHHPSDSDVPSRRAMTECNSAQIPGIFGEAALILSSEEDELKKMTALALVIEVRIRLGGGEEGVSCPKATKRGGALWMMLSSCSS